MKIKYLLLGWILGMTVVASSQTNITLSNPEALQILKGNYDPASYLPTDTINDPDSILQGVINRISQDTLIKYLLKIDSYHNRNTGSDTVSGDIGIGAVRRWIYQKFEEFGTLNENRLVLSYMDFNVTVCGQNHHRNVLAILPGLDTTDKEIMVLEGHFDTRCEGVCDTACYSPGMEDNGSGTVLVMELARIMSRYAYDHTIVFACVTGEDQGLYGSTALANYLKNNNVKIRACFNNDVIGGIICGQTSSPPSCPGLNNIDSTHVRIFSYSKSNDSTRVSPHKQLARYIKLHQIERINPLISTPMEIDIIIYEDRIGRSGDQVPFRQKGYTAIRFCAKNEHGNGSGTPPDRQHSVRDILGVDTSDPPDGIIDSFFVDPNYLRRNIISNGVNLGWLAIAPPIPDPEFLPLSNGMEIVLHGIDSTFQYYRVGIRSKHSGSLYFDTVYTFTNTNNLTINGLDAQKTWYFSVANVKNNVEGLFCDEYSMIPVGVETRIRQDWGVILEQNAPNPFSGRTEICIEAGENPGIRNASVVVNDMTGHEVYRQFIEIQSGKNFITITKAGMSAGFYTYSLVTGDKTIATLKMLVY